MQSMSTIELVKMWKNAVERFDGFLFTNENFCVNIWSWHSVSSVLVMWLAIKL